MLSRFSFRLDARFLFARELFHGTHLALSEFTKSVPMLGMLSLFIGHVEIPEFIVASNFEVLDAPDSTPFPNININAPEIENDWEI